MRRRITILTSPLTTNILHLKILRNQVIAIKDMKVIFNDVMGEGGYGVVYKVFDPKTNRNYALKIGHPGTSEFMKFEYETTKKIFEDSGEEEKKCIMMAYSSFYIENRFCYLSELLSLNLFVFLQRYTSNNQLSINNVQCIAFHVVNSLIVLHSKDYVHLDLKPENIMFTTPDFTHLKLGDFGCTITVDKLKEALRNQKNNLVTDYYRPPEIILSLDVADTKVDIWSLGCMLMELAIGYVLYPGKTNHILLSLFQRREKNLFPENMITNSPFRNEHFDKNNQLIKLDIDSDEPVSKDMEEYLETFNQLNEFGYFDKTIDELIDEFVWNFDNDENNEGIDLFKDLLNNMLKIDPRERYTIENVRNHNFFNFEFKPTKDDKKSKYPEE